MNTSEKVPRPKRVSLKLRKSFKSKRARQQMTDRTCSELALEGERLCREGQWDEGVQRLEAATRTGTSDLKTLSALYSQLGNAYFYLEEYAKALECHKQDLSLARSMADKLGEAKACGNIGSALKALGQFEEAVACCRLQLDLAREIGEKVLESRALYNLGNVYHAQGKHASLHASKYSRQQEEVDDFVRASLEQAARHYEANLKLVRELGDQQAQGRTVGNLGNTYYLLGNYKKAIKYHEERLSIAESLNDLGARRRAFSNLGNAHVFLGKYSLASHDYLNALEVAREMGDSAFEAQSCYSLGNVYTLMQSYHKAIEYHMLHLQFAIQLGDRVGEARAYWSLGNAYTALGDHRQARHFAEKQLQLSLELGDEEAAATAKQNLADLNTVLELSYKYECASPRISGTANGTAAAFNAFNWSWVSAPMKRKLKSISSTSSIRSEQSSKAQSLDDRLESTGSPDSALGGVCLHEPSPLQGGTKDDVFPTDDGFFDMITRFQGHRLDDQRTSLPPALMSNSNGVGKKKEEDLLEVLWQVQGSRIEEQRCHMMSAPHVMPAASHWEETEAECLTADELFELIFTCQDSRINDQRSQVPAVPLCHKSTMPSEDFFNLIQHLQSTRIEDQRSPLPILAS